MAHIVDVSLGADQVVGLTQQLDNPASGGAGGQRAQLVRHPLLVDDVAVLVDAADDRQLMALADVEVIGIVSRRDLERTCAKVGIDKGVGYDRQLTPHQGEQGSSPM